GPLLYRRPSIGDDGRLFRDLVAYAPGLNTSAADIRAVLEAEGPPDADDVSGSIDPAARALIDTARGAGWQAVTLPGEGPADWRIVFDGKGRHAFERALPSGLRERVVCDGRTLLHLYPEIGLGARRTLSRFHREEFARLVPWLLPPAEDLARGAELRRIARRTVAV